jgi:cation transport ATPase
MGSVDIIVVDMTGTLTKETFSMMHQEVIGNLLTLTPCLQP